MNFLNHPYGEMMTPKWTVRLASMIPVLALAWALPCRLPAMETAWLFDGSAGLISGSDPTRSYSGTNSSGPQLSWDITPLMGWHNSGLILSPSWDFSYSGVNSVLKVDDNLYLFSQQLTNTENLGGSYNISEDTRFKLYAFGTQFNSKQTLDETWGYGLYDYQDLGAWTSWTQKWDTSVPLKTEIGYQFSNRQYPNYFSLTTPTVKEKDADINKVYLDTDILWPTETRLSTTIRYSLQVVNYTQAQVIDSTGTTSAGTLRLDYVHDLALVIPILTDRHEWTIEYDLERRFSNYNYLDAQQVVYQPDYESYLEQTLNLSYNYLLGDQWWLFQKPYLNLAGTVSTRGYDDRLAKSTDGSYSGLKEHDESYLGTIGLTAHLSENWSAYFNLNYSKYLSNNSNSTSSLYNYNFTSVSLGTQWSY